MTTGCTLPSVPDKAAGRAANAVVNFSPCGPGADAVDRKLPPELTYGCVDWFDYKNHPLRTPAEATLGDAGA